MLVLREGTCTRDVERASGRGILLCEPGRELPYVYILKNARPGRQQLLMGGRNDTGHVGGKKKCPFWHSLLLLLLTDKREEETDKNPGNPAPKTSAVDSCGPRWSYYCCCCCLYLSKAALEDDAKSGNMHDLGTVLRVAQMLHMKHQQHTCVCVLTSEVGTTKNRNLQAMESSSKHNG